ncbi:F-box domain [Macleaya cordata]|uniref:F-box domain n=1 Tax=Macleaya cordata TaxID=56857 RepID=A0A200PV12_MACCD|nr:F-box domain [Macleaya cordata]
MKRPFNTDDDPTVDDEKMKKTKVVEEEEEENQTGFTNLDEDLLFEVLKHVDAKSLAKAGCVSKQWHKTAQDERLWEMICTRHWANTGCGNQQLRSVVLALGGFRRLHTLCLWPLLKPPSSSLLSSSSSSAAAASASVLPSSSVPSTAFTPSPISSSKGKMPTNWGKDEVHLSLSLLSIRYYEKMNLNTRGSK